MAGPSKKRAFDSDAKSHKKPRVSDGAARKERSTAAAPAAAAVRPAPSFTSALKGDEVDFPRGGGTSLTAFEVKQVRDEGRREADAEARATQPKQPVKRRQVSERQAKRAKKNEVDTSRAERDKDTFRVEELSYKRLVPGTRVLGRVHTILPLHLIVSLPNNLLAHVPIASVSSTLASLLKAEETMSVDDEDEDEDEASTAGAPDLGQLFFPGQYVAAKVSTLFPTASQDFIGQYPVSETTRLAARVALSLAPADVNADVARADIVPGFAITGEVLSEEDKGLRVGLGVDGVEGFVTLDEAAKLGRALVPGQLVSATVASASAGGRVVQLSLDPVATARALVGDATTIGSILPGHLVSCLITAVVPSGLNVKICGFYDGSLDLAHLGLGEDDIDDKFKIGKKIRARIIYDTIIGTEKRFALSVLPHIVALASPMAADTTTPLEAAMPIGKTLASVQVTRVLPDWGVMCRTDDGVEGFAHISHLSDDRLPALSAGQGQFKAGTYHRARVLGHSPLDGVVLLSFEQKVLDQVFMQVSELRVGQLLKGTIRKLSDRGLFVDVHGSVDGVVWPLHYADIRLKHPEKRFKVGGTVKARVFALEPARGRVVLTLKKSLVDSTHAVPASFADVRPGAVTPAVVSKLLDKGCIVDLFGGLRAFVPQSEAAQAYVANLADIFYVGKPVDVRITSADAATEKIVASVRQALPTALAAEKLDVGADVAGIVAQVHKEQVAVTLVPSQLTALLSLSNLSNHRGLGVDELRQTLSVGDRLDDLVVVSKNATSGLLIVANKKRARAPAAAAGAGVSGGARALDELAVGQVVPARVISHTPAGAMLQLGAQVRGRVHLLDMADDLAAVAGPAGPAAALKVDDTVLCCVLGVDKAKRAVDLSTRKSRTTGAKVAVVDPEINSAADVKEGQAVRGLVKTVGDAGVFVSLGRAVTARIMIKELFDDDWKARFEVGQLASGKVLAVTARGIEMTLRTKPRAGAPARARVSDYAVGQKVDAAVKRVEPYGLFLRIDGTDLSGLCHKSEMSDSKKQDVALALKGFREGDKVRAAVVSVDLEKGKINFSIKASRFKDEFEGEAAAAEDDEEAEEDQEEEDQEASDEEDGEEDADEDEDAMDASVLRMLQENGDLDGSEDDEEEGDEDEDDEEDEEDEEEEGEDEDEDEEEDEEEIDTAPASSSRVQAKSSTAAASTSLSVGAFDWSGTAAAPDADADADSDTESESSDAVAAGGSSARKAGRRIDLAASGAGADGAPGSEADFERALLASPDSSFLWIQYMSFLLAQHEVERARATGRRALDRIGFREEAEKLNVWMALVGLELGFGTEAETDKVFKQAVQHNDARAVYARYIDALVAANKDEMIEPAFQRMLKKFSAHPDTWARFADFYLRKGDVAAARALLPRALQSLDKSKHVEMTEKMAVLEFKHGDAERGKTLFEGILDRHPRRLDIWNVYIDQCAKVGDIATVRGLIERALQQKLTAKRAKFLFKKWLSVEGRIGDAAGQDKAKERARAWVAENAKSDE